jgi:uncharacterized phage-like protein YoqJ/uncharacterized protein YeaO (DUF488 family)
MLFTGSIRDIDPLKYDEIWVIVRSLGSVKTGGNIYHIPQLSPSTELFHDYLTWKKQGIWNQQCFNERYTPRFLKEMEKQNEMLNLLRQRSKEKNILICCFCDNENMCHRSLVKALVEKGEKPMSKTIAFTGRRPKDLCGYNYDNYRTFVKQLTDILDGLNQQGYSKFISGGAQGFDQLAFWAVNCLKREHTDRHINNVVYVPFRGQECRWAKTGDFSQADYNKMLRFATETIYLSENLTDYSQIVNALHSRNHAMIDDCDLLVALYPSDDFMTSKGGTAEAMRYAKSVSKPILQIRYVINNNELSIVDTVMI